MATSRVWRAVMASPSAKGSWCGSPGRLRGAGSYPVFPRVKAAEAVQGPQPQDADGPGGAPHAAGHLLERQALQVAEHDHLAVGGGELGDLVGHEGGQLA